MLLLKVPVVYFVCVRNHKVRRREDGTRTGMEKVQLYDCNRTSTSTTTVPVQPIYCTGNT
jgi:hypothetical protein